MLTPAPEKKILRRMDYISDQKGIFRRYLREKDGWQTHLEHTGDFITGVLQGKEFDHIVVLGSGWLLDFPFEKVLPMVRKITLVDVNFPVQVLRKIEAYKTVECVRADITGGYIKAVYDQLKQNSSEFFLPGDIEKPRIKQKKGKIILSLNILNQLDILLIDYIRKKTNCDPGLILQFRKKLQESHIQMLQEHPFILITDFREILINNQGFIVEEKELIFTEFPFGELIREWDWSFDSHRLYNPHADTKMKVRAIFSKGLQKL